MLAEHTASGHSRHDTRQVQARLPDVLFRLSYHEKGLERMPDALIAGQAGLLVITRKDRLRFGAELMLSSRVGQEPPGPDPQSGDDGTLKEDLTKDALEVINLATWITQPEEPQPPFWGTQGRAGSLSLLTGPDACG